MNNNNDNKSEFTTLVDQVVEGVLNPCLQAATTILTDGSPERRDPAEVLYKVMKDRAAAGLITVDQLALLAAEFVTALSLIEGMAIRQATELLGGEGLSNLLDNADPTTFH